MFSGTRHGSVQCLGVIVENSRQGVLTVDGGVLAIFIAYRNSRLPLTASALMPRRLRPSKHILNKLTSAQYRQPLSGNGIESLFDAGQVSGDGGGRVCIVTQVDGGEHTTRIIIGIREAPERRLIRVFDEAARTNFITRHTA